MLAALEAGLVMGAIYALLALAINIIYSTTDIINFAHAELVMLGGMLALTFIVGTGMPYIVGAVLVCILIALVALLVYFICVKPFGNRLHDTMGWLLATLGAGIIIMNAAQLKWGSAPKAFPHIGGEELISWMGIKFLPHDIWVLIITLSIAVLFTILLDKTFFGNAIRATQFSHDTTKLMGIGAEKIIMSCFIMSGTVAAIASLLVAPITFVQPMMTSTIGLKGFGAAIIGGLGNNHGALVGGLFLGLVEAIFLGVTGMSPGYRDIIAFLIMIVVISIKPEGLLGVVYEQKV
jgi:branched-chain amino acid transport system permease protein